LIALLQVRRIAKRDVENAKAYAVSGFAKSLLDVGDDFERAIQAVPVGDAVVDAEAVLKTLVEGTFHTLSVSDLVSLTVTRTAHEL
jgi:molecular chaperone GrpE (heat shock protein)